jgi:hypothetical protein
MPECVLHILFPECVHALALERVKENEMEMEREGQFELECVFVLLVTVDKSIRLWLLPGCVAWHV